MSAFVLAHLSDPHLGPLPRPSLSELAGKRALGFWNWRRKRRLIHRTDLLARIVHDLKAQAPDHIALTGDIVNIALADEFPPARGWLDALGSLEQVTVVPGNHDAYVRRAADHRQLHWGAYMRGDDAGPSGEACFPFVRRRGAVALIGLSSAVPTGPLMATGQLGAGQLARLAPLLEQLKTEGLYRIVLIHHPPLSPSSRHFKRLIDGAAFRDVLARYGAELVLHGHDHVHSVVWLSGPRERIPAVGVPSASGAADGRHEGAAYNLYRIERHTGGWRCEMASRGLVADGEKIIEIRRMLLSGH